MKIQIKYFTSTGNTMWLAEKGQELFSRLGHQADISNVETQGMEFSDDAEMVGIFYPVWGSTLPDPIKNTILKIKKSNRKMFFIGNCAAFTGDTGIFWKKKIETETGYDLFYADHVVMPMNVNIPWFNWLRVPDDKTKERILVKAEKRLEKICSEIIAGKRKVRGHNPFGKFGAWFQRQEYDTVISWWTSMMDCDTSKCTGCKFCEKTCPVENIQVENNTASFENNCILCLRCYNLCPRKAILVGEQTKDRIRYRRYKGAFKDMNQRFLRMCRKELVGKL